METEHCMTPIEFISDLEKLSHLLLQHYEKNIEIVLNPEDEAFLENVCIKLSEISAAQNVRFNEEGFKTFVKKLFFYDFAQFGGNDDIMVSTSSVAGPSKYDFFAIALFIASIFMLYISFLKFNELAKSVTGVELGEIGQDAQLQIQDAIAKIRELPLEQVTFLQYVWNSIQTFSCSIVEKQASRIRNIITQTLNNVVVDFTSVAEATCLPRTEVVTEGLYTVKNIDIGRTFNSLIQTVSAVSARGTTSSCIANTALSLQRRAMEEMFHQRSLILNQLNAQSSQAIHFLMWGARIGTSASLYLIYRTKDVLGIAYSQIRKKIRRGGKHNTKKNKNKKHKKTSRRKHKKRTVKR